MAQLIDIHLSLEGSKVIRPIGDVSILHNSIRTAPNTFVSSKINTKIPEKTRIIGSIRNVNNLFRENRKRWKTCIAWNIRKFETFDRSSPFGLKCHKSTA